jgi:hypothetical protein
VTQSSRCAGLHFRAVGDGGRVAIVAEDLCWGLVVGVLVIMMMMGMVIGTVMGVGIEVVVMIVIGSLQHTGG